VDDGRGRGGWGGEGNDCFPVAFRGLAGLPAEGEGFYPLDEVLLLMLAAALAGAETVADMARFGRAKLEFLRCFRFYVSPAA
jgi:hypothetical protein